MILPRELYEEILLFVPFEKVVHLSEKVSKKIYNPNIHTWDWAVNSFQDDKVFMFLNKHDVYGFKTELIEDITIMGDFDMIKWFYTYKKEYITNDLVTHLMMNGCYDILNWVLENDILELHTEYVCHSIYERSIDFLEWLNKIGYVFDCEILKTSIECGKREYIKWLYTNKRYLFTDEKIISDILLKANSLQIVELVQDLCGFNNFKEKHFEEAIKINDFNMCLFYHLKNIKVTKPSVLGYSIQNKNLKLFKWLVKYAYIGEFPIYILNDAIRSGDLESVKFLHQCNNLCSSETLDLAAAYGNLEIFLWLYQNCNKGYTINTMDNAAASGNLDIIKILHEDGHGCTTDAIDYASEFGHLEVLKFLHQNRTEGFTTDAIDRACELNNENTAIWLLENTTAEFTQDAISLACSHGNLKLLKKLLSKGICRVTPDDIDYAAENGQLELIQWVLKNDNITFTSHAINGAVTNGYFEMVKWLFEKSNVKCTQRAFDNAIQENHIHIAKWLRKKHDIRGTFLAYQYTVINGNLNMLKWISVYCPLKITPNQKRSLIMACKFKKIKKFIESI